MYVFHMIWGCPHRLQLCAHIAWRGCVFIFSEPTLPETMLAVIVGRLRLAIHAFGTGGEGFAACAADGWLPWAAACSQPCNSQTTRRYLSDNR